MVFYLDKHESLKGGLHEYVGHLCYDSKMKSLEFNNFDEDYIKIETEVCRKL